MSEENKSQLVEEVEQQTAENEEKQFDAAQFLEDDSVEPVQDEVSQEVSEESVEQDDEDGFSWDSIEIEKDQQVEEQEASNDEDWDIEEEEKVESSEEDKEKNIEKSNEEVQWDRVAEELGIEGASKEDIINTINELSQPKQEIKSDAITAYSNLLKLGDRDLLAEEMKADGMEEYDIEDALDKMEDTGILKRESARIKRQLKGALNTEKKKIEEQQINERKSNDESTAQNKKELQSHLKEINTYFGGRVKESEKKDLYKYIISGKFNDDIYESHANVAEVAWMWKNKERLKKILRTEGFEAGKAHVLNKITSPSTNRTSRPATKIKSGKFDVTEFMKE
tara:strand:+ start:3297 stop:4313 length:1017 start_codon:yes stop_codon:yes gene_type:complete